MTEQERIDTDKLKTELKRQKEINKMLIAHEADYIKTLHGLKVKIEALQDDNNNLYKTKCDLEEQLIQCGWAEYIGADEVGARAVKKFVTVLKKYILEHMILTDDKRSTQQYMYGLIDGALWEYSNNDK